MPVKDTCDLILQRPCPYKTPPLMFIGGHSFCPCIMQALKVAYLGGYADALEGKPPEVGVVTQKEASGEQPSSPNTDKP